LPEPAQSSGNVSFHRWAEMRLEGQYHEISVDLPEGRLDEHAMPAIESAFAAPTRASMAASLKVWQSKPCTGV
jgi:hypothetical protein